MLLPTVIMASSLMHHADRGVQLAVAQMGEERVIENMKEVAADVLPMLSRQYQARGFEEFEAHALAGLTAVIVCATVMERLVKSERGE